MRHSLHEDQQDIQYHYDLGIDFYRLFLGEGMVYSCAYFLEENEDLDQAQLNKLDYICRKLRLRPGETFLDISCGWGGLILHAARSYRVKALGITSSQEQFDYVEERIKDAGLSQSCRVELVDYRQLTGEKIFDKISSVGMFEHVGIKNFPVYF